jgi:hypothetical protein
VPIPQQEGGHSNVIGALESVFLIWFNVFKQKCFWDVIIDYLHELNKLWLFNQQRSDNHVLSQANV